MTCPRSNYQMSQNKHQIPNSIMKASRDEIDELKLTILKQEGNKSFPVESLPDDLSGHVFIAAPLPYEDGSFVLNGDGMIYRLDLTEGKAKLKTRIAKTPCYYADVAIQNQPENYPNDFKFKNGGPSRMSLVLGSRNQLNTAFLKTSEQLFVTFDAGRPYEIDPSSLEILEPVGSTENWKTMFPSSNLFGTYANPAHPVSNSNGLKEELFTINYSTGYKGDYKDSIQNIVSWIKNNKQKPINNIIIFTQLFDVVLKICFAIFNILRKAIIPILCLLIDVILDKRILSFIKNLPQIIGSLSEIKEQQIDSLLEQIEYGYTKLICYDLKTKNFKSLEMILPDEKPVSPDQTIHQMAITKDYIIFMDIAFKVELSQIFYPFWSESLRKLKNITIQIIESSSNPFSLSNNEVKKNISSVAHEYIYSGLLRFIPPKPYTNLYIISRKLLSETIEKNEDKIKVQKVTIPREVSHFTADYCNPDDKITLHIAHNNGSDVTEWIRKCDSPVPGKKLRPELAGMLVGTTDLGSLARYVIDGKSGVVLDERVISDTEFTWSLSVDTHNELCDQSINETDDTVKNIYWMSWGFSWENIPKRIYEFYKNGKFRHIHHDQLPKDYKPTQLLRLDTEKMEIVDSFEFPYGHFACTPQFIPSYLPCPEDKDPSIHGYIVCVVLADNSGDPNQPQDEFWILHADDFNNKPVYRLSSPHLNLGLAIHSTWLQEIDTQKYSQEELCEKRKISFDEDYGKYFRKDGEESAKKVNTDIERLLKEIRKKFIEQTLAEKPKKESNEADLHHQNKEAFQPDISVVIKKSPVMVKNGSTEK